MALHIHVHTRGRTADARSASVLIKEYQERKQGLANIQRETAKLKLDTERKLAELWELEKAHKERLAKLRSEYNTLPEAERKANPWRDAEKTLTEAEVKAYYPGRAQQILALAEGKELSFKLGTATHTVRRVGSSFRGSMKDSLEQSPSKEALSENIATEVRAGKDPRQAAAIAYSTQRSNDAALRVGQRAERFSVVELRGDRVLVRA